MHYNSSISLNVFYHLCLIGVLSCSIRAHDFPIIPFEPEIKKFPHSISEDETNVEILKIYYQDVAAAYLRKGQKLKEKYLALQLKLQKQEEDLMLSQGRAARSYVSWNKSIKQQGTLQSMQHSRRASDMFCAESIVYFEKAAFYQDLADNYKLLSNSKN